MRKVILLFSLLTSIFYLNSCKKYYDDRYQQKGNYGNSGISTYTFSVSNWSQVVSGNSTLRQATVSVPSITQSIIDNGTVLLYMGNSSPATSWLALPFPCEYGSNNVSFFMVYSYSLGSVKITISNSDGTDPGDPGTISFKAIVLSNIAKAKYKNIDWKNYEEVKNYTDNLN